jgi:hypothetical protein
LSKSKKLQAPPGELPRRLRDAVLHGDVREELPAVVAVEREHLLVDVGDEEVLPSVGVEIRGVDPHSGARLSVDTEAHLRSQPQLFPAVSATIDEQEVLDGVVRDEEVHQAVVVDVGRHDAERLAERLLDVGAAADLRERAVAVVVEEQGGGGLEHSRDAVVPLAQLVVAAEDVLAEAELDEAADEEIEPPVVVIVEPHGARRPAGRGDSRLAGHIGECGVAVVAVEDAPAVRRDEEIREAVIVIVADRDAHPERAAADACFLGHVGERAVAVVSVQRVAQRLRRRVEVARAAVHQIDVQPPVVVEIEERAARAHRLRQVPLVGHRVLVHPCEAALRRRNLLEERRRGGDGRPATTPADARGAGHAKQAQKLATGRSEVLRRASTTHESVERPHARAPSIALTELIPTASGLERLRVRPSRHR